MATIGSDTGMNKSSSPSKYKEKLKIRIPRYCHIALAVVIDSSVSTCIAGKDELSDEFESIKTFIKGLCYILNGNSTE
jgi:hypothetical protein